MGMIKDISLYAEGRKKIDWVKKHMPILNEIKIDFEKNKYFSGKRILVSVHVEAKTAYLAQVLKSGGAEVIVAACNPLSTQDDVAAALEHDGIETFAIYGADSDMYEEHLKAALLKLPDMIIDDGGDLVSLLHGELSHLAKNIIGGAEETTTGVVRLKARQDEGGLLFPMLAVNDSQCKYLFDNRYGTGQSVWNAINRTTNLIAAGKRVVIAGYGWCGKGTALRAKGLGAKVIICEIDPIKSIEAVMDGFEVMTMAQAAKIGDIFITVTGCKDVINNQHFDQMKDGVIMCNAGHFDVEINLNQLKQKSIETFEARKDITAYKMKDNRTLFVLAQGRLVNLAAGDGHPAEIMDMSFSVQAMAIKHISQNYKKLENKLYDVPEEIDSFVAKIKLKSWGIEIDSLSEDQKQYLFGKH